MSEMTTITAKKRDRAGKGGARSSRRDGLIPAVIYGDKQPPVMIAVEPKSIERELHKEGFFNHRLQIDVDGQLRLWLQPKVALADMYYYGQGVEQNYREAVRWLREAVEQHEDAYALYSLAYCLLHGQGVRADVRTGLRLLRRAAVLGDASAQHELGSAYYRGQWLARNPKLAMRWLRSAAAGGNAEARAFIERVQREGMLN